MNLKNTPLKEKFEMLSYLQKEVKGAGNFLIQYLKTKNQYQISFINGLLLSSQSDDIEVCVNFGIIELESHYSSQNEGRDFYSSYQMQNDVDKYRKRIIELEDKVQELENNYSRDISNAEVEKLQLKMLNKEDSDLKEFKRTKRKRGRPAKNKQNLTEQEIIDSPIIWDASDKKKKQLRERTKTKVRSRILTEKEIEEEMRRLNSDLPTTFILFRNTEKYEIERKKAYKRLAAKKYNKLSSKRQNLNISQNKYNITKDDIIDDMKRVLKSKFDNLSNIRYIKQWTLAKARVWNREYTRAKNNFTKSW